MASITAPLLVDTGDWDFARSQMRMYRFADRLRWVLEDAGLTEGRAYYGDPAVERPGFRILPISPDGAYEHCEVTHFDQPGTDTRPLVARYHTALEAAGFRCEWGPVLAFHGGQYARFRVYPPKDAP